MDKIFLNLPSFNLNKTLFHSNGLNHYFNLKESKIEPIEVAYATYYERFKYYLIMLNSITSLVSIIFCLLMIYLYFKHRKLRNSFTILISFLMFIEFLYSFGKFMSIGRLITNRGIGLIPCNMQANIILFSEFAGFIWTVFISHSICQLLIEHDLEINNNINSKVLISVIIPIIICVAIQSTDLYLADDDRAIWCWIKNDLIYDGQKYVNPVIFIIYGFYVLFIVTNMIFYRRLRKFSEDYGKESKDVSSKKKLINVVRKISMIPLLSSICYSIALTNRIAQVLFDVEVYNFIFWIYLVHIPVINFKGTFYFCFCLDEDYFEFLSDLFSCKDKMIDDFYSTSNSKDTLQNNQKLTYSNI